MTLKSLPHTWKSKEVLQLRSVLAVTCNNSCLVLRPQLWPVEWDLEGQNDTLTKTKQCKPRPPHLSRP